MKIAVVGCGAMGSVYAALLAGTGNEVLAVDSWAAHVAAINRAGLRVEGASGDRIVRLRATTAAPRETMDLVIIAAKATGIGSAAAEARSLTGSDTAVLTIQNGLGSADIVAAAVGPDRLAVGIAGGFGAAMKAPGHAFHNGMEVVRMGAHAGLDPRRVDAIAALWRAAGFRAEAVADIAAMQWDKLICNVAYSAPCALTGLTVGQVIDDPDIGPVSRAAAGEAWAVAKARGIRIDIADPVAHVRAFGARIPNARPSLAQDLERGRRGEIDMINGAVPREAAKVGIEAPVNATLTALVRQREAGFSP
ncbi:MAG: 2-dehydropantoate 2-reductase [Alphaproteobacteria bacterium]|jgi:2-dehydropantoate 2-reductase|nr:2-dehydropantoate 2-reductase [Alphaproteobacteria bacterium]